MPTPLLIDTVKTASVQSGHQDIFAEVTNYNQDWYATFDYSFSYSGGQSESYSGFINPNTTQTLSAVNLEIANRPSGLSLSLANLTWHHIDQRLIPDIAAFLDERDNITVEVPTYATDISLGKENLARASFTLTNRTAYSYWEPVFLVKLSRGSSIIALTTVSVPEFKAGESRPVEVRWFGSLPATASVAVEPLIPYFDDRIYMRPSSE
jgi:hypothetical protein